MSPGVAIATRWSALSYLAFLIDLYGVRVRYVRNPRRDERYARVA